MGFPCIESDGGHKVIIYTATAGGNYPVHGAYWVGGEEGYWSCGQWTVKGEAFNKLAHPLNITKAISNGSIKIPKKEAQEAS